MERPDRRACPHIYVGNNAQLTPRCASTACQPPIRVVQVCRMMEMETADRSRLRRETSAANKTQKSPTSRSKLLPPTLMKEPT